MGRPGRFGSPEQRSRGALIALGLIFLVALGLRLFHLDSMEFKGDEAFNLMKARQLARLERFPLTSATSSTGIPEPPVFMYLLAVPITVSDEAVFVTGAIAVLNALAVIPCYLLVRRHLDQRAALIAAALFAVNPWQVVYSRKIWTQDTLPFFALTFLLLLFEATFRHKPRLLAASLAVLAVSVQLHLSAAFLLPFTALFLLWQRHRIRFRYLAIGIGLALALFLPYSIFLAAKGDQITGLPAGIGQSPFIPRASGILYPLQLVTTDGFDHVSLLFSSYQQFEQTVFALSPLNLLARGLLIAGTGYALIRGGDPERALVGYGLLSVGSVLASNIQIFPHYYNALLPILLILMALPLAGLIGSGRRVLAALSWAILLAVLAGQLYFTTGLLRFIAGQDCIWGEYGPPYRVQVEAIAETVEAMRAEGVPLAVEEVHERASSCVNWDILATQYVLERIIGEPARSPQ